MVEIATETISPVTITLILTYHLDLDLDTFDSAPVQQCSVAWSNYICSGLQILVKSCFWLKELDMFDSRRQGFLAQYLACQMKMLTVTALL